MASAPSGVFHPTTRPFPWIRSIRWSPRTRRVVLAIAILLALVWIASRAIDEPLRASLERRVNAPLKGYTATIGHAHVRFLGLGLDLRDVTVVQNSLPNPPVIYIPSWKTTVQWRALLSGALVADVTFTRPAIYLMLSQAQVEAKDPTPTAEHGWQDAVTSVYPLEINLFRIEDGTLDYFDTGEMPPVRLRKFSVRAENIRNVRSVAGLYPSPFELKAAMADGADLMFKGRADFLATPHATLRGDVGLRDLLLKGLKPALRHMNVNVESGRLAARGEVEYTPKQLRLALDRVSLDGAKIDYVIRSEEDAEAVGKAAKATTTAEAHPENRVDVEEAVIGKSTLGIVNRTAKPPYRVFISDTDVRVAHFSNQQNARRGSATLRGRFMGTGPLRVDADFAPAAKQADFHVIASVEDVDLAAMNDVLRAQADIDVTKGRLSIFSETTVRNGRIEGYVKPLFADVDVYDSRQDAGENPFHQAYEAVVGAASSVLTNRPRDEVATITSLSGPVESPSTSTWDMIVGLLRNAFIKAIRPGLEPRRR
jgi:hypothetical protein